MKKRLPHREPRQCDIVELYARYRPRRAVVLSNAAFNGEGLLVVAPIMHGDAHVPGEIALHPNFFDRPSVAHHAEVAFIVCVPANAVRAVVGSAGEEFVATMMAATARVCSPDPAPSARAHSSQGLGHQSRVWTHARSNIGDMLH
jgi:mRNA-degrading endonuclease toxin of MazEF toxin-antitoxin module